MKIGFQCEADCLLSGFNLELLDLSRLKVFWLYLTKKKKFFGCGNPVIIRKS